jgi:hypothetical protein
MQPKFTPNVIARFWSKVDRSGGPDACWPWTGCFSPLGYGRFWAGSGSVLTHRYAMALAIGYWPENQCVLHRCDNPPCCNPVHLFVVTNADNVADAVAKGRAILHGSPGERHPRAKLTETDVRFIRSNYVTPTDAKIFAAQFGVTVSTVFAIVHRRNWRHLD